MKNFRISIFLFTLFLTLSAKADDFQFMLRNRVLAGKQRPAIMLKAMKTLRDVRILLKRSDGKRLKFTAARVGAGTVKTFEFRQKTGHYTYNGTFSYKGIKAPVSVSFDCLVARPLSVVVVKSGVDLNAGRVLFKTNRVAARTRLKLFDKSGEVFYDGQPKPGRVKSGKGPFTFEIRFPSPDRPVGMAQLQVFDENGFYGGVQMEPFMIKIPHEEVEFDFGKWTIRPDQAPKLQKTLKSIQDAIRKLHRDFTVNLYIAGYTDTVGSDKDNLRLSTNRARAIARWFLRHGVGIPVYYQGFGEKVLKVATPDNTPEPRNRRAVYILAPQAPGDRHFPASAWHRAKR